MRRLALITTGGTIEKTYDERTGSLSNRQSIVRQMLAGLRLEDTTIEIVELMSKDSLDMTDEDRALIVRSVQKACDSAEVTGVVILHGTDTLTQTGEAILAAIPEPRIAVVLTGAMRPYEMKQSDALQNLTEAVFSSGVLDPGVYCVTHGRALAFPGVVKNRETMTFVGGRATP